MPLKFNDDHCQTGCWVSRRAAIVTHNHQTLHDIVDIFTASCACSDFMTGLVENAKLVKAAFHPNDNLEPGNPAHDKFQQALDIGLPTKAALGLVFHGTPAHNVPSILQEGLNPALRNRQSLGKGEYFAKDPRFAQAYTHGGSELLVFVVVLPQSYSRKHNSSPGIVVVNNNLHQVPIGTITFENSWNQQNNKALVTTRRKAPLPLRQPVGPFTPFVEVESIDISQFELLPRPSMTLDRHNDNGPRRRHQIRQQGALMMRNIIMTTTGVFILMAAFLGMATMLCCMRA